MRTLAIDDQAVIIPTTSVTMVGVVEDNGRWAVELRLPAEGVRVKVRDFDDREKALRMRNLLVQWLSAPQYLGPLRLVGDTLCWPGTVDTGVIEMPIEEAVTRWVNSFYI